MQQRLSMHKNPDEYPKDLRSLPNRVKSQYLFVKEIGSGKTGRAYQIRDRSTDHDYCLKSISPAVVDDTERERVRDALEKEVRILNKVRHRCLPQIPTARRRRRNHQGSGLNEGMPYTGP